jgi:tRNA modification GTPase
MSNNIIALATPHGIGALAIIRISGDTAIETTNILFKGKNLINQPSHTIHFGKLVHNGNIIDEVLISLFKAPHSFTKEHSVEISCHGSPLIVQKIIEAFLELGVSLAKPGEFTQRAFLNGRFDLTQAEAVSDLINADSDAAHEAALHQMRGGFSAKIKALRQQLIWFASLIELELDFGEEDVEFAERKDLEKLITELQYAISELVTSFQTGNAIKNGIPTVIAGKPNAGKSTLLNALLNEEKAIVSEIPGTTRDFIEDTLHLSGITFRFTDTAGLRESQDKIEQIGVQRTYEKMNQSALILYMFDITTTSIEELRKETTELERLQKPYILVGNKQDIATTKDLIDIENSFKNVAFISAHKQIGLDELKKAILSAVKAETFKTGNTMVTNLRHYESLLRTQQDLQHVMNGLKNGTTGDILAMDIRHALFELGQITGEITTEDLLDTIFSKFCIGK